MLICQLAQAADTTEVFDPGASDFELFTGYDGIGLEKADRALSGEVVLGYGLTDRFSASAGFALEGGNALTEGYSGASLGVFATPLDTDHFDFDLYASMGSGTDGGFELAPGLELNLDAKPDLEAYGFYLRTAVPIYGRTSVTAGPDPMEQAETVFHLDSQVGVYWTLAEGHQVLLEHDFAIRPDAGEEERDYEVGGIGLGYNVQIAESMEMINQLTFDIPQGDDKAAFGIMTGFIATLPTGAE